MGPEAKLYKKFKKATPTISWNRIENLAVPGMPDTLAYTCLLYTSPSPRDGLLSRMPSSA